MRRLLIAASLSLALQAKPGPTLWHKRRSNELVIELFQHAQTAGLLCPARPERNEVGDIRVWLDGQGTITNVQREGTM